MAGNFLWFASAIMASAMSYLIHSTLLLASVWLFVRFSRRSSHTLEEGLWKWAAVLGLLTVPLQLSCGWPESWEVAFAPHGNSPTDSTAPRAWPFEHASARVAADVPTAAEFHVEPSSTAYAAAAPAVGDVRETDDHHRGHVAMPQRAATNSTDPTDGALDWDSNEMPATPPPSLPDKADWDPISKAVAWSALLLLAYMVVCCVVLLVQSACLGRQLAKARPLSGGPAQRILTKLLRRHAGGRAVRLLSSDRCLEPVVFGLLQWTIVLPASAEHRLSHDELRALLSHEVAHLVRRDLWWLWIGRVLCTCLAFQPLNFLARRRWGQAAEYLCDAWALQRGVTGLSLARCLTRIAQWKLDAAECHIVLAATGSRSNLVRRVERLTNSQADTDPWTTPPRRRQFRLVALLVAAVVVAVAPRVSLPSSVHAVCETCSLTSVRNEASDALPVLEGLLLLDEELSALDADLVRVNELLHRFPPGHRTGQFTEVLEGQSQRIREHRLRIVRSITQESYP